MSSVVTDTHTIVGSVANWQRVSVTVKSHDRRSASVVSGATLCRRSNCPLRTLVPPIFTQLSRCGRADGRTAPFGRFIHHLEKVQRYAPELNARIRRELKPTNGSWRTDETYVRVAGRWTYLYRAVDSSGATIDFFLSETRDVSAAWAFFRKALAAPGHPRPRVINVNGNPSYPNVIDELKRNHVLGQRCAAASFLISTILSSRSPCNQKTHKCEPRLQSPRLSISVSLDDYRVNDASHAWGDGVYKRREPMKYICLGYIEPGKFEAMTESEQHAMLDECFDYDDYLRADGYFAAGEALQPPQNAMTLYWKNGKVQSPTDLLRKQKTARRDSSLEACDLNHAVQLISQHPGVKYGPWEIRPTGDLNAMLRESERRRGKEVGR